MSFFRILFLITGFFCAALGTVGIFLPILPTTPFYILAAFCFAKGSTFFHRWFTNTRLYKKHFESFANSRSMTIETKLGILIPVSIMLTIAVILMDILIMRIVIITLALIKWWYFIYIIKTVKPSNKEEK